MPGTPEGIGAGMGTEAPLPGLISCLQPAELPPAPPAPLLSGLPARERSEKWS